WRRDFGWLGLSRRVGGILTGFGLGLILPLPVAAVLAVTGGVRVTAFPGRFSGMEIAGIVAGYLGWALYTGVVEELVFRGMAVREWAVRWGWPAATVAGGLWFGLAHLLPGLPEMAILPLAQVLLAAVAFSGLQVVLLVRRRSLWLPIGLHAGWNFTLAGILGATVSGRSRLGLFNAELSGPAWLTGGEFGLEASLVAVAVYILAAGIIWRWPDSGREPPLPLQPGPVNRPAKETQDQPDI
ncbi:MAG: CPBP family intramembrane metalloprotease, partial [Acidobacteria bacterium]|nr:CPBP family intramembrane metalloprotease [Acidobacteriota bacterium]